MARMTSYKEIRCEFATESDEEHEFILRAIKEGRAQLDIDGKIGISSKNKTRRFIQEVGVKAAGQTAVRLIRQYYGQKEPHDYQEGNVVFIYTDNSFYCKVMFLTMADHGKPIEKLFIDVHRCDRSCYR